MTDYTAQQIHLVSRPTGVPSLDNFKLVKVKLEAPGKGQVLVDRKSVV